MYVLEPYTDASHCCCCPNSAALHLTSLPATAPTAALACLCRNNSDTALWVEWMSALKLNHANQASTPADFHSGVRVTQQMEPELMRAAALRGFRYVSDCDDKQH